MWFLMKVDGCTTHYNDEVVGGSYLPACQAGLAQEMPTGLNTSVLIPLCTDLAQLEGAADLTVKLILLLSGVAMVVRSVSDNTENDKGKLHLRV